MQRQKLDPENESHRKDYSHRVSLAYMQRFHRMVKAANPAATVDFNGRQLWNLAEEYPFQGQIEIEALPTGGWGYMFFSQNVRFARNFPREYIGMTARFHRTWADFGGL